MLNYRNTMILFIMALSGLILTDIFRHVNPWWYIGIIIALITLLACGSVIMKMGFYLTSYCSGTRNRKEVAFSFDDGPDNMITPIVLNLLKEHNIKAAFFVIGNKVEQNAGLIRSIEQEGHIIGGHSYSHHFFFDLLPEKRIMHELKQTVEIIHQVIGKRTRIFRPPYGVTNPAVAGAVRRLGYHCIGWSLKSKDTTTGNGNVLFNRLRKRVKPGDVVLFHDTQPVTLEVLPKFIAYLKDSQYQLIRPDQLLKIEAYE